MFEFLIALFFPFLIHDQSVVWPLAVQEAKPLAVREFSLNDRYANSFVNDVFRDNILLTLDYLDGKKIEPSRIDWANVRKPFEYKIVLKPGETFAFHDDVLPEYASRVSKTTNAHFNAQEGFRSSGWLVGDGVCHLASLLYWVAQDAGLEAVAKTNHNFANIPEVPKEYGVSIYTYPGKQHTDQVQNLYITNNKDREIAFEFKYDGENLKISAVSTL